MNEGKGKTSEGGRDENGTGVEGRRDGWRKRKRDQ